VLGGIPGVADLSLEANVGKPQIRIEVDREELARHGMNAEEVLTIVRNGLGGEPVSVLLDGVKRFDISVRLEDDTRGSIEALRRIPLKAASGALVPLAEVANVTVAEGYSFVRREQLQRYAVIQMDVRGRDVDSFVKEAAAAIEAKVELPPGYWVEWGGAFENQQRALAKLSLIVPITIFFIFVLLYTAFNSIKFAALILANVPFATIGGLLALVRDRPVPVGAVGDRVHRGVRRRDAQRHRARELPQRTARTRTLGARSGGARHGAATASGADDGERGHPWPGADADLHRRGAETQRPLATVVVGGLLSSTLLTLILLPVLYEWLENRAERRAQETAP
jgi:cobalt-zinc-cadmium resistance protein CzcA